jgi:hypothetical protein
MVSVMKAPRISAWIKPWQQLGNGLVSRFIFLFSIYIYYTQNTYGKKPCIVAGTIVVCHFVDNYPSLGCHREEETSCVGENHISVKENEQAEGATDQLLLAQSIPSELLEGAPHYILTLQDTL